ncbi:DUF6545 domain-containing protein [Micromonospora sp. CA-263727]|uniref:DUF6545 domain-containing protein n=1 Tax=Micromonospora sp. CA-263727 TaxID=3239967 RepID=UPI003D8F4FA1
MGVDLPPGLLVRRPDDDSIIVDSALPALARTQTVLHEVAHLVLGHDGDVLHDGLAPAIEVEVEAELAADLLYQRLMRAAAAASPRRHRPARAGLGLGRAASAWLADRRTDWHLLQLWMTLRDGIPDVAIVRASTATPAPVEIRNRRQRHRTLIEIHEALRVLRPWCSSRVLASATARARRHRLDPDEVVAVADAATIAVALRHRRTSQPPTTGDTALLTTLHGPLDVLSEARRLGQMARALHDSPLVVAEAARWVPVATSSAE